MRALIAIVGPTAVGKTDLAMALAERMAVEVVNADSRQVYRYMDIGTGKPSKDDRARVEHHLIDVANPDEDFSLATYLRLAEDALETVASRDHIPLIVGGTGLYLWSLVERWQVPEVPPDPEYRKSIEEIAAKQGHAAVHDELARIDAVAAARIHPRNVRRVIRALELFRATGTLPSELLSRKGSVPPGSVIIGLGLDRARLFARADARVDRMIGQGFADEVRALLDMGFSASLPAMTSIGYREMIGYVLQGSDLETTVAHIKRETRRLIRRQHAWFHPEDKRITWLDYGAPAAALDEAARIIQGVPR
jgi:tRNA dimethylallyltransferase